MLGNKKRKISMERREEMKKKSHSTSLPAGLPWGDHGPDLLARELKTSCNWASRPTQRLSMSSLSRESTRTHLTFHPRDASSRCRYIYIYVFEYDSLGKCDYVRHAESTRKAEAVFGRDAAGGGEHHSGGSESSAGIHTEAPGEGVRPRAVPLAHCLLLGVALV